MIESPRRRARRDRLARVLCSPQPARSRFAARARRAVFIDATGYNQMATPVTSIRDHIVVRVAAATCHFAKTPARTSPPTNCPMAVSPALAPKYARARASSRSGLAILGAMQL